MTTEPINLDCLSIDPADYDSFARDESNHPQYRAYARYKAKAMRARLAGNLDEAGRWEAACDRIYDDLDSSLVW